MWISNIAIGYLIGGVGILDIAFPREDPPEQATPDEHATAPPAQDPRDECEPSALKVFWKDTLRIESPDKNFKLKLGGRFQGDWGVFDPRHSIEADRGGFDDGTEVRRARLYYSGSLFKRFEFKTQIELSERNIEAKDVYVGLINLPVIGNIRAGHFKEPFGLNELTSSKYIMFMERSLTTETFAPGRNTGIMVHNTAFDERMAWAVGLFRDTGEFFNGEVNDGLHLTSRITAVPWVEDDGRKLFHIGLAWSHQAPHGDDIDFDARPEAHLAPKFAGTDDIDADAVDLIGVEAALVYDSFSLQGEYVHAMINRQRGSDLAFSSFYLQASYLLTGEHRNYETDVAEFGRIRPARNFGQDGGLGAWEVAARFSYLDLNDDDIRGGRVCDVTAGLNWYLNPNVRVSWNYVYGDAHDSGFANTFQMRLQVSF
jgi:phosphate-selective porin OprO/OprP